MQGIRVWSLVKELKSHILCQKTVKEKKKGRKKALKSRKDADQSLKDRLLTPRFYQTYFRRNQFILSAAKMTVRDYRRLESKSHPHSPSHSLLPSEVPSVKEEDSRGRAGACQRWDVYMRSVGQSKCLSKLGWFSTPVLLSLVCGSLPFRFSLCSCLRFRLSSSPPFFLFLSL